MTKNKLTDLNNHLFAQLERLNDEDLTEDKIKTEVIRAKAISGIANQIIQNARVTIDSIKLVSEGNLIKHELPDMLISTKTHEK